MPTIALDFQTVLRHCNIEAIPENNAMLLVLNAFNEEVFFDEHIKWKKQIWNQIKYKKTETIKKQIMQYIQYLLLIR